MDRERFAAAATFEEYLDVMGLIRDYLHAESDRVSAEGFIA